MRRTQIISRGLATLLVAGLAIGIASCGSQDHASPKLSESNSRTTLKEKTPPRSVEVDRVIKKN